MQRGSSLLYALMAVGASSAFVSLILRQTALHREEMMRHELKNLRSAVFLNLGAQLVDPNIILSSVGPSLDTPGNVMLRNCLGLSAAGLVEAEFPGTLAQPCNMTGIDTTRGMAFLLFPPQSVPIPQRAADAACYNPDTLASGKPITCFLAGQLGATSSVGYSWKGGVGVFGADFPMQAKTYFYAQCNPDDPTILSCPFAPTIQVRHEIVHSSPAVGRQTKSLSGTYPSPPVWLTLNTAQIVGSMCNPGAKVAAQSAEGGIRCHCQLPYRARLGSGGNPLFNAKGPLCEQMEKTCPPGMLQLGWDSSGNAMCKGGVREVIRTYDPKRFTSKDGPFDRPASCNESNLNGWAYKINVKCRSTLNMEEKDCPENSCGRDMIDIAIGAGVGLLAAIAALIVLSFILMLIPFTIPAAIVNIAAAVVLAGAVLGGAIGGYILGENTNWFFLDSARANYAEINCRYELFCAYFR
ncbi:MAG: hypothetical protein KA436_09850 [Oligoflexales bacterium]|nr:hypothetical protein [Oligoflexales bacterium]